MSDPLFLEREKQKRREYNKKQYDKDDSRRKYMVERNRNTKRANTIKAFHLLGGACKDCGETDIDVIEFDHVRGTKIGHPCKLRGAKFFAEVLEKCEPVCCNCHRRRTIKRARAHLTGIPLAN